MKCLYCGNQYDDKYDICPMCGTIKGMNIPYNQQINSASQNAPMNIVKSKSETAWPILVWILAIAYFLTYITSRLCDTFRMATDSDTISSYISSMFIYILAALLVPVLFAIPTKKIAFITATPAIIFVLGNLKFIIQILKIGHFPTIDVIYNLVLLLFQFALLAVYVIQMFVRNRMALPIVYTVLYVLYLLFNGGFCIYYIFMLIRSEATPINQKVLTAFGNVFYFVSVIILGVVYCIATFSVRKEINIQS